MIKQATTYIAVVLTLCSTVSAFAKRPIKQAQQAKEHHAQRFSKQVIRAGDQSDLGLDENIDCRSVKDNPVCGADGMTYANDCYRQENHVPFASDGVCSPAKWAGSSEATSSEPNGNSDFAELTFQVFKADADVIVGSKDDFIAATYIIRERLMVLEEAIELALENDLLTELEEQGLLDILDSLAALVDIRGDLAATASFMAEMESLDVTVGFCSIYGTLVNEALASHSSDPMVQFLNWLSGATTDQDALYAQERRTGRDWNNDGVIGNPNSRRNRRRRGNGVIIVIDWLNGQSIVDTMNDVGGIESVNAVLQQMSDELNSMTIDPVAELAYPARFMR